VEDGLISLSGVNLASVIDSHPDDSPALISRGKVTTYGELRRQVGELRYGLRSLGIEPGERVAIVAANNWFFVVSYLATLGVGAVAVPLNPGSPTAEVVHQLAAVEARTVIVGPSSRVAAEGMDRAQLGVEHVVATEPGRPGSRRSTASSPEPSSRSSTAPTPTWPSSSSPPARAGHPSRRCSRTATCCPTSARSNGTPAGP
jgi:acyl-CoA synthetase (AMP-forming)/AMP-acid ligase II